MLSLLVGFAHPTNSGQALAKHEHDFFSGLLNRTTQDWDSRRYGTGSVSDLKNIILFAAPGSGLFREAQVAHAPRTVPMLCVPI